MKQCKQCGRTLDEECFRKTKSRSKGIYKNTSQGTKLICRSCESLNVRAHKALKEDNQEAIEELRLHYERLRGAGHPPVTAAARRLLGDDRVDAEAQKQVNESLLASQQYNDEVLEHARKVRDRLYSSIDEADSVHRRLEQQLRDAGLYEDVTNQLDDWYMDE